MKRIAFKRVAERKAHIEAHLAKGELYEPQFGVGSGRFLHQRRKDRHFLESIAG